MGNYYIETSEALAGRGAGRGGVARGGRSFGGVWGGLTRRMRGRLIIDAMARSPVTYFYALMCFEVALSQGRYARSRRPARKVELISVKKTLQLARKAGLAG